MSGDSSKDGTLGRIALKQVRVKRSDLEARKRKSVKANGVGAGARVSRSATPETPTNPLNRLVPYLDLFSRLGDEELARLAGVGTEHAVTMRAQVDEIAKMLSKYDDLAERLSEEELVRLSQATPKIVRFWLLSRPRRDSASTSGVYSQLDAANESGSSMRAPADSQVGMAVHPSDSQVGMAVQPPASDAVDISMDSSPGEESGAFDPALLFEDDDEDDDDEEIDLF
jgi:hypothetical protein